MAKVKIQKKDIWIDMTPMSDVMTLLLCFFMLTSTFLTPEPIQVTTPSSVSEKKVPESDVLNILVSPKGQIYLGTENKNHMKAKITEFGPALVCPNNSSGNNANLTRRKKQNLFIRPRY